MVIKASSIKDDRTLFIIFNCNFSNFHVIFLVSGSRCKRTCPISSAQALSIILLIIISSSVL